MPDPSSPGRDAPVEDAPTTDRPRLGRRSFLIGLGTGTAAIAGYFLARPAPCVPDAGNSGSPVSTQRPRLAERVLFGQDGEMTTLRLSGDADSPLCALNPCGAEVAALLDGRHTVAQIASILAKRMGTTATEAMQSQIAYFITQVGEVGLLQEPYYACIIETRES